MSGVFFDGTNDDASVLDSLGKLPDGSYKVCVADAVKEWAKNSPGVGLLKCEFDVLDDDYLGRKIFSNFILKHPKSERAVKIGRARFKEICVAATGDAKIEAPEDLYGKPFYVKMVTKTQANGRENFEIEKVSNEAFTDLGDLAGGSSSMTEEELQAIF